jgi:hypothetical protein
MNQSWAKGYIQGSTDEAAVAQVKCEQPQEWTPEHVHFLAINAPFRHEDVGDAYIAIADAHNAALAAARKPDKYLTCVECSHHTLRYSTTIDGLRCQNCGAAYVNCKQVEVMLAAEWEKVKTLVECLEDLRADLADWTRAAKKIDAALANVKGISQ